MNKKGEKEKVGIYIDFDNLYSGILATLKIEAIAKEISKQEESNLKEVIKIIPEILHNSFDKEGYNISYIKSFAEYENIPHSRIYKPSIQTFLYNIGIKPINPFIHYNKKSGKTKNASDIALSLEIVTDLQIKNIPIDAVCILTGDIDLYPLVYWIKEHTNKKIYILSFNGKLNKTYRNLKMLAVEVLTIDEEFKKALNELSPFSFSEEDYNCKLFEENLLAGLDNWFIKKNNDYLSTGLIIKNWLPKWKLDITPEQANSCLKNLINSGKLEQIGYKFTPEESQSDELIKGKITKL